MPNITIENPDALGKPLGQYSQLARVKASEFLFIAGQVATDRSGKLVGENRFAAGDPFELLRLALDPVAYLARAFDRQRDETG